MVELVDTQDLKSCDLKSRAGSIPALSTQIEENPCNQQLTGVFLFQYTAEYTILLLELTVYTAKLMPYHLFIFFLT
jgi:hypothetical protein